MDKFRRTAVTAGIFFGFVVFAIAVFFIPPSRALAVGILAAALFTLITSLVSDISFKKYRNLDQTIDQDIIHKDIANYYSDRYIRDGLLYLTKDRLIFCFLLKKSCIEKIFFLQTSNTPHTEPCFATLQV
jgi:ABC-type transport system involved in multi-copper enzyme maturation permease subunit